ncbi:MAG: DUF502 domain-containing protein [Chloroflexi bacterium]|nr:DUF502 domain-containing protein [Chloroflexota bacterium]
MTETHKPSSGGIIRKIRAQFLLGLVVLGPIGATIIIFIWIFTSIDNILQPVIRQILGRTIPGLGFGVTLVLVYLAGVIASNVFGRRLIRYGDTLLARVPVVRQLYGSIKQILMSFSRAGQAGFLQVVLVEWPREGMKTVGFVTNEFRDRSGEKLLSVFIPQAPIPTTGFLQIMREEEVVRTTMSVDDAMKMVVSAGKVAPRDVDGKPLVP